MLRSSILFALLGSIAMVGPEPAAAAPLQSSTYQLGSNSALQYGCFGPCDCAVQTQDLRGTFLLTLRSQDPLFTTYDVSDVRWSISDGTSSAPATGFGTYRVGGEFAVQHQMILDLQVGSGAVQRFDSGLVPGENSFPSIDITLSVHGMACTDSVLVIHAKSLTGTSAGTAPSASAMRLEARPNPFAGGTAVRLTLPERGRGGVVIYDASGRLVRKLAADAAFSAGPNELLWDGARDDRSPSPSGIYFLRARWNGETRVLRLLKLR